MSRKSVQKQTTALSRVGTGGGNAMGKYAVFVDDGMFDTFDDKERAKECAAEQREKFRSEGRRVPCFVKKMTKEEERMFG